MTEEKKKCNEEILSLDTNEQLIARLIWYVQNSTPGKLSLDDNFRLVQAEILRRMVKPEV